MYPIFSICISILGFEVFKLGFKIAEMKNRIQNGTVEQSPEEELGDGRGVFVPPGAPAGDRGRVLPGLADRADRQLAAHADGQGRLARHVDHALS